MPWANSATPNSAERLVDHNQKVSAPSAAKMRRWPPAWSQPCRSLRFIGASNGRTWRLAEARCISQANGWSAYCVIQQRHSYLRPKARASFRYHECVDGDLLDYCRIHGIALVGYRILLQGAYTRDDRSIPEEYAGPDSDARLTVLKSVAKEMGATPNQGIVAWMRQGDPPILPIVGGSNTAQLAENLDALDIQLSDEQMSRLDVAGV